MGTVYALLNKTKNERVHIDNVGQKFFEMMSRRYSNFVVWLLLINWKNDHVIFRSDKNECDMGYDFYDAKDKSKEYWEEFEEFTKENDWYFEG